MKSLGFLISCTLFACSCGPAVHTTTPYYEETKSKIRLLAILPFEVSMNIANYPRNSTIESMKVLKEKIGYNMQKEAFTWFLKRSSKYSIQFQDIEKTNSLLRSLKIPYSDLMKADKGKLCSFLGVDAIITAKTYLAKINSDGEAIANSVFSNNSTTTRETEATITIHDSSNNLLWSYQYFEKGGFATTSASLTNEMMKNMSKKFPYRK